MSFLFLKMLFYKEKASAVVAVALLVAISVSTTSVTNYVNSQVNVLGSFVNLGKTYIVVSKNSSSTTDSKIDSKLVNLFNSTSGIKYMIPQKVAVVSVTVNISNCTTIVRGVKNVGEFLKSRNAYINGTVAKSIEEVDVGEILARLLKVSVNDEIILTLNKKSIKAKVVGIFKTLTQDDTGVIAPLETVNYLTGNDRISVIEFTLEESANNTEVVKRIGKLLPKDVMLVKVQQIDNFLQTINQQTLRFLFFLSVLVYIIVAIASYLITVRFLLESSYELLMLRALGAKKNFLVVLVLTYAIITSVTGSLLGIAVGLVGTQVASTILAWLSPSINIIPFLEFHQLAQILLLSTISSFLGSIIPALRLSHVRYVEQRL
ncbi:MAG: ABC transporter permease [Candidatus Bathyarchaeales archaeon]